VQACEQQILQCLSDAFGPTGGQCMDMSLYKGTAADRAQAFTCEASWRCAALEAMHAWLHGYVAHLPQRRRAALCVSIADALRPVTALALGPDKGKGGRFRDPLRFGVDPAVAATLMTFQQKLLEVYLAIPYPEAFEDCWDSMLEYVCIEPLRDGATHLSPHSRRAVHGLLLAPMLNQQDEALAPYLQCEDDGFAIVRPPVHL
jgi:hypothetical protein